MKKILLNACCILLAVVSFSQPEQNHLWGLNTLTMADKDTAQKHYENNFNAEYLIVYTFKSNTGMVPSDCNPLPHFPATVQVFKIEKYCIGKYYTDTTPQGNMYEGYYVPGNCFDDNPVEHVARSYSEEIKKTFTYGLISDNCFKFYRGKNIWPELPKRNEIKFISDDSVLKISDYFKSDTIPVLLICYDTSSCADKGSEKIGIYKNMYYLRGYEVQNFGCHTIYLDEKKKRLDAGIVLRVFMELN
jgi:hypothetical protein